MKRCKSTSIPFLFINNHDNTTNLDLTKTLHFSMINLISTQNTDERSIQLTIYTVNYLHKDINKRSNIIIKLNESIFLDSEKLRVTVVAEHRLI